MCCAVHSATQGSTCHFCWVYCWQDPQYDSDLYCAVADVLIAMMRMFGSGHLWLLLRKGLKCREGFHHYLRQVSERLAAPKTCAAFPSGVPCFGYRSAWLEAALARFHCELLEALVNEKRQAAEQRGGCCLTSSVEYWRRLMVRETEME